MHKKDATWKVALTKNCLTEFFMISNNKFKLNMFRGKIRFGLILNYKIRVYDVTLLGIISKKLYEYRLYNP